MNYSPGGIMAKYRIIFHEDRCIGCGACQAVCPENWELHGDKSRPKKLELEELSCNEEAKNVCPTGAIEIVEE